MLNRKQKLSLEPSLSEDHIIVAIRHPVLGHKTRIFKTGTKMVEVYLWTGSLNPSPEFFELIDYNRNTIYSDENALSGTM